MIGMPITFIVIILLGLFLRLILKNKSDKIKNIPLTLIAICTIVLEIAKQTYLVKTNQWTYRSLPVHFCSFFLFWLSFAQFSWGRAQQVGYCCSLSGGILMTILLCISPTRVIGIAFDNLFLNFSVFHGFAYHFLVVAYWIWLLCLGLYKPKKIHILVTTILYTAYYFLILACSYAFNTNYTNSLYSNIAFMEQFRLAYGQVAYTILMFAFGIIMIAFISTMLYLCRKREKKRGE